MVYKYTYLELEMPLPPPSVRRPGLPEPGADPTLDGDQPVDARSAGEATGSPRSRLAQTGLEKL